jgi:hypothetical protein
MHLSSTRDHSSAADLAAADFAASNGPRPYRANRRTYVDGATHTDAPPG